MNFPEDYGSNILHWIHYHNHDSIDITKKIFIRQENEFINDNYRVLFLYLKANPQFEIIILKDTNLSVRNMILNETNVKLIYDYEKSRIYESESIDTLSFNYKKIFDSISEEIKTKEFKFPETYCPILFYLFRKHYDIDKIIFNDFISEDFPFSLDWLYQQFPFHKDTSDSFVSLGFNYYSSNEFLNNIKKIKETEINEEVLKRDYDKTLGKFFKGTFHFKFINSNPDEIILFKKALSYFVQLPNVDMNFVYNFLNVYHSYFILSRRIDYLCNSYT